MSRIGTKFPARGVKETLLRYDSGRAAARRSHAVTSPSISSASPPAAESECTPPDTAAPAPAFGGRFIGRVAAALKYRDFRVLWLGACTSSIGTWMQKVAQSWLVLELTNSGKYLALDAFLGELPILLFTLIGGVVADRRNRRTMLLTSQFVQMTSALMLALLVLIGRVHIWEVLALSFMSGCAQAFGGPAYQSLIPSLVDKEHLPNAIALNSIQFNIARVLGPLLAGVTLHAFGSAACFGLNGVSFLVVIAALFSIHPPQLPPAGARKMRDELFTGLRYVRDEKALLTLTILALASTFLGVPLLTFLPVFAKNVFHSDVGQYSQMMAWSGVGAIAGALAVAWLGKFRHMGRVALALQVLTGLLTIAFTYSRVLWVSHLLLLVTGAAMMIVFSLFTSLVQLIAPNEMRGRVMSAYMVAFRGGMPLGSLATGVVVDQVGAPLAIAINGALLTVVAVCFLIRFRTLAEI
jgi:predicted MFS family arabinose efflux permease